MYRVQGSHLLKMDWLVSKIDADIGGYIYICTYIYSFCQPAYSSPRNLLKGNSSSISQNPLNKCMHDQQLRI